jgi:lambda repressor-like predicted transcriptional regulator
MTSHPPTGIEINYRLRQLGWTQAALARELGVTAGMVNNVVHNRVTCHRVAQRIADLLVQPIQSLWPGRYEYKPRSRKVAKTTKSEGDSL